jgi:hypothetical protein
MRSREKMCEEPADQASSNPVPAARTTSEIACVPEDSDGHDEGKDHRSNVSTTDLFPSHPSVLGLIQVNSTIGRAV